MSDSYTDKLKEYPVLVGAAIVAVVLILAIYLRSGVVGSLNAEYDELMLENKAMDYNVLNGKTLDKDLEELVSLTDEINKRLMNPKETADIYHYFFSLEKETGVAIGDPREVAVEPIMPEGVKEKASSKGKKKATKQFVPTLAVTEYSLNASGDFKELLRLMQKLEGGYYFGTIKRYTLGRSKDLDDKRLSMSINLGFFGVPDS